MKQIFTILVWVGGFVFLFSGFARAETFHQIKTAADFQNALTIAQSNGEDDVIKLPGKTFSAAGGTFLYIPTENHSLSIIGANYHSTKLDGENGKQVLMIDTTSVPNGDDGHADITIKNMTIQNGAGADFGGGLGIITNDANVTVENCAFSGNTVTTVPGNGGGAGIITFSSGNISVTDSRFDNNSADIIGGLRVDARSTGTINVINNSFTDNRSVNNIRGNAGLGLDLRDGNALAMNNIFNHNQSMGDGGAAGTIANGAGTVSFINNMFSNNTAGAGQDGGGGGGLAAGINGFGNLVLINNSFFGNSTQESGHGPGNGGGIFARLQDDINQALIFNNIVYNNTADGNGQDIYIADDGSSDNHNNIGSPVQVSHNDYGDFYSFCVNAAGCTPHVTLVANLPNLDPLFVDGPNGDLHLTAGSPCIDQGDSAAPGLPATDIDGDPRIIGAAPDIGADEFKNP